MMRRTGRGDASTATMKLGSGDGQILSIHLAFLFLRCAPSSLLPLAVSHFSHPEKRGAKDKERF